MLKSIIRRAVEAAFSIRELEEAITERVAFTIDYEAVVDEILDTVDLEEMVLEAAAEHALDIVAFS